MDKKEREAIRQRRDEAIAFVSAEMTGKKKRYAAFVKEIEGTSLEGGAPGMEKLCALMSRCLPQDCKTMLETAFRVFFGDGIGNELEDAFNAKNYDNLAGECVVNRRTIAVSFDGNISVTDKKEKPFDGLYLDMEEYEKLKNSIPPMMRQSFIDTLWVSCISPWKPTTCLTKKPPQKEHEEEYVCNASPPLLPESFFL